MLSDVFLYVGRITISRIVTNRVLRVTVSVTCEVEADILCCHTTRLDSTQLQVRLRPELELELSGLGFARQYLNYLQLVSPKSKS